MQPRLITHANGGYGFTAICLSVCFSTW